MPGRVTQRLVWLTDKTDKVLTEGSVDKDRGTCLWEPSGIVGFGGKRRGREETPPVLVSMGLVEPQRVWDLNCVSPAPWQPLPPGMMVETPSRGSHVGGPLEPLPGAAGSGGLVHGAGRGLASRGQVAREGHEGGDVGTGGSSRVAGRPFPCVQMASSPG